MVYGLYQNIEVYRFSGQMLSPIFAKSLLYIQDDCERLAKVGTYPQRFRGYNNKRGHNCVTPVTGIKSRLEIKQAMKKHIADNLAI